jgi:hypothetical protein
LGGWGLLAGQGAGAASRASRGARGPWLERPGRDTAPLHGAPPLFSCHVPTPLHPPAVPSHLQHRVCVSAGAGGFDGALTGGAGREKPVGLGCWGADTAGPPLLAPSPLAQCTSKRPSRGSVSTRAAKTMEPLATTFTPHSPPQLGGPEGSMGVPGHPMGAVALLGSPQGIRHLRAWTREGARFRVNGLGLGG